MGWKPRFWTLLYANSYISSLDRVRCALKYVYRLKSGYSWSKFCFLHERFGGKYTCWESLKRWKTCHVTFIFVLVVSCESYGRYLYIVLFVVKNTVVSSYLKWKANLLQLFQNHFIDHFVAGCILHCCCSTFSFGIIFMIYKRFFPLFSSVLCATLL